MPNLSAVRRRHGRAGQRRHFVPERQSIGISRPGRGDSVQEAQKECASLGRRRGPVFLRQDFGDELPRGRERRLLRLGRLVSRLPSLRAQLRPARCCGTVPGRWDDLPELREKVSERALEESCAYPHDGEGQNESSGEKYMIYLKKIRVFIFGSLVVQCAQGT